MDVSPADPEPKLRASFDIRVLGCKVNAYEAQQIRRRLELNGLRQADDCEDADVVVVHSCAVTRNAVRKSRQTVRRLQQENPGARVIVTGCAASEDLLSRLAGVDARIGPREDWLEQFGEQVLDLSILPEVPPWQGPADHLQLDEFRGHARAFLKIQDGCDIGCSFCIVPRLRRAPRDKPLAMVVQEAEALVASGHRELVISGVSVGLYGRHTGGANLAEVARRLIDVPGLERIRISSLHPGELTDELLEVWASSPRMMPHIHLPLQAGSDRVLKAMRRNYTAAEFLHAVDRARDHLDDPAFNADIIVGFPGESAEDFAETLRVSRAVGFSRMHIFPYSMRPHTRAARRTDPVPKAVARARASELQAVAEELSQAYHHRQLDRPAKVLTETFDGEAMSYRGYSERYVPVEYSGPAGLRGKVIEVWPVEADAQGIRAVYRGGPSGVAEYRIDDVPRSEYVSSLPAPETA